MANLTTRGPGFGINYPDQQNMNPRYGVRNSKESLMDNSNDNNLGKIASDNVKAPYFSNNTENQLNLSEKIYNLELKIRSLEMENKEYREKNNLLNERIEELQEESERFKKKPILEMKNHEEERKSWKIEREQLENRLSMLDSMIRSLNEDKLHMGEKISMLEMNLARPTTHPPIQTSYDYPDPRDALRTIYPSSNPSTSNLYSNSEIKGVKERYSYPISSENTLYQQSYWDPLLTCEVCGMKFPRGEIQLAREHLISQHPQ